MKDYQQTEREEGGSARLDRLPSSTSTMKTNCKQRHGEHVGIVLNSIATALKTVTTFGIFLFYWKIGLEDGE